MTDKRPRFPVRFDEGWWAVDLDRAGPSGRSTAEAERSIERDAEVGRE